jgi:hypothetical protein
LMTDDYWRLQERLHAVSMALWGVDGQNGLSSKVRNHDRRLTGIEDRLSAYDQAQLQIRTVWATARWIGLGVAALIGFIMTTPVATFLANVWRAGSGP